MAAKPAISSSLKLGNELVALRFDFAAADTLDQLYGIDIFDTKTYGQFTPSKIASMIWAGQLHRTKPASRAQIVQLLDTAPSEYEKYCAALAQAVREAILK